MSLMDNVFDIRAALKDTPDAELFEEVEAALWSYENRANTAEAELRTLKKALAIVGTYMMQKVE